jgi:hypothetical protein
MMSGWLARLKNEKAPGTPATKPTKPPQGYEKSGFVGFVAYPLAPFQKIEREQAPANDGQSHAPDWLATVDRIDLNIWPHTQAAMNPGEVDIITARLARFTDKGVSYDEAERLADKLVIRDREGDDRGLCLEYAHLQGYGRWRCGNWKKAEVARDWLARDLAFTLQRCGGFFCFD